jgi:hypothetical protein
MGRAGHQTVAVPVQPRRRLSPPPSDGTLLRHPLRRLLYTLQVPPQEILGTVELRLAQTSAYTREAMLLEVRPDAGAI